MMKAFFVLVALVVVATIVVCFVVPSDSPSDEPVQFGQFMEIRHETYEGNSYMGFNTTFVQYTVYNVHTKVVYLYTVYRNGIAITPYFMRNIFGELTVGVYNTKEHIIEPMEPYYDEYGEELVIIG